MVSIREGTTLRDVRDREPEVVVVTQIQVQVERLDPHSDEVLEVTGRVFFTNSSGQPSHRWLHDVLQDIVNGDYEIVIR